MVLRRQVRRQESDRRQVHRSIREQVENHRKLPGCLRGLDAIAGSRLREAEDLSAVPEQGTRPFCPMELTCSKFRQVGDELDGRLARALGRELQPGNDARRRKAGGSMATRTVTSSITSRASAFFDGLRAPSDGRAAACRADGDLRNAARWAVRGDASHWSSVQAIANPLARLLAKNQRACPADDVRSAFEPIARCTGPGRAPSRAPPHAAALAHPAMLAVSCAPACARATCQPALVNAASSSGFLPVRDRVQRLTDTWDHDRLGPGGIGIQPHRGDLETCGGADNEPAPMGNARRTRFGVLTQATETSPSRELRQALQCLPPRHALAHCPFNPGDDGGNRIEDELPHDPVIQLDGRVDGKARRSSSDGSAAASGPGHPRTARLPGLTSSSNAGRR